MQYKIIKEHINVSIYFMQIITMYSLRLTSPPCFDGTAFILAFCCAFQGTISGLTCKLAFFPSPNLLKDLLGCGTAEYHVPRIYKY